VSSFQNPWSEPGPSLLPESPTPESALAENPPWTGWDVLQIALLTIALIGVFGLLLAKLAQHMFYPHVSLIQVGSYPLVAVSAQGLAYLCVFAFMVTVVKQHGPISFSRAVRWNWPRNPALYLLIGVLLSLGLQALAHFLPIPKQLPMDRFFQTPREIWVLSLFGMTFAPAFEELFFRGFLYPVLVRRTGIALAVLLTAASFALLHALQLGMAWGPVLVIFLVGLTLTITRLVAKSVAPGFLIHVAYNGTISVLIFIGTDGYRHLEKLSQ
jgi:uncharacterized protein